MVECAGDELVIRSNGIPHYDFKEELATALGLTGERFAALKFAASARALGVEHNALREALGIPIRRRRPNEPPRGPPAAPADEAPCRMRCGTSDENAVGRSLTLDHKVICTRPCENKKRG